MHRFIAHENIKRFKELLGSRSDERQRETVEKLLAAEEKKLKEIETSRAARREQQAVEIEKSQTAIRKSIAETERLMDTSGEMLTRHGRERDEDDNQSEAAS